MTRRSPTPLRLVRCVAVIATLLWAPLGNAAPPAGDAAAVVAALSQWDLQGAERLLAASSALSLGERTRATAELAFRRSDFKAVVAGLKPYLAKVPSDHRARVLLGRALYTLGQDRAAFKVLDRLADDYNADRLVSAEALTQLGISLQLNGLFKNANRAFHEAASADPRSLETKLAWADLFYSKYKKDEALRLLQEAAALPGGRELPELMLMRARLQLEQDSGAVQPRALAAALAERRPECVPAHNLLARLDLTADRPEDTVARLLATSLTIAPRDPVALGLLGAAYQALDDKAAYLATEQRALAVSRKNALFYELVATHANSLHRYGEALKIAERGLRLAKDNPELLTIVAVGYSRSGNDKAARKALERAHVKDPYNAKVFNLLTGFFDKIDKDFAWIEGNGYRLRADRGERELLSLYVPELVTEALTYFEQKYQQKAKAPLHIEIFESGETFSMRSAGHPLVVAHGICFGHVITARSPSQGAFSWGNVLWHELAHVFHLQISNNRVPRWFTEGLAMLEASEGRLAWRRPVDAQLAAARRGKRPLGVRDFNLAFTQAKSIEETSLAYIRGYHLLRFIRDTFGPQTTTAMLKGWGRGLRTAAVFEEVLEMTPEAFDGLFEAWLDGELAWVERAYPPALELSPRDSDTRLRLAVAPEADAAAKARGAAAAYYDDNIEQALTLADEALALDPEEPWATYAELVRALAFQVLGRPRAAREALLPLVKAGRGGLEAIEALAVLEEGAKDFKGAMAHLEAGLEIWPENTELMNDIGDLAAKSGDDRLAIAWWAKTLSRSEDNYRVGLKALAKIAEVGGDPILTTQIIEHLNLIKIFDPKVQRAIVAAADKVGLSALAAKATRALALIKVEASE